MSISRNPHLNHILKPNFYQRFMNTFYPSLSIALQLYSQNFLRHWATTKKRISNILPCSYFLFPKTSLQLLAIPKLPWLRIVFKVNYFLKIIPLSKLEHYANVESLTLYKHLQPKFTAMNNIYSYIMYNFKKKPLFIHGLFLANLQTL